MLRLAPLGRGFSASVGRRSADSVSQNDINQIILAQLSALGERLDNMEKNKVKKVPKKTGDMSKIKTSAKRSKVLKLKSHSMGSSQVWLFPLVQYTSCHHRIGFGRRHDSKWKFRIGLDCWPKILNQVLKKLSPREGGLLRSL